MEIKCPVCQKRNINVPICTRCDADFSDLILIRKMAESKLKSAKLFIKTGAYQKAYECSTQSFHLFKNPLAAKISLLLVVNLKNQTEANNWKTLLFKK